MWTIDKTFQWLSPHFIFILLLFYYFFVRYISHVFVLCEYFSAISKHLIYAADICSLLLLPAASSFVVVVNVVAVVDRTSGEIVKQIEPSVANCEPHASNAREKLKRSSRARRANAVVVADAVVGRGQTQWPTSRRSDVLVLVCPQ